MEHSAPIAASIHQHKASAHINEVRRLPVLRLLLLTAFFSVSSAILAKECLVRGYIDGPAVHIAVPCLLLTVYVVACWYAWNRFRPSKELRWLLVSAAFFTMCWNVFLQVLGSVGYRVNYLYHVEYVVVMVMMTVIGLTLMVAGHTKKTIRIPRIRFNFDHLLLMVGVLALCYFVWRNIGLDVRSLWRYLIQADRSTEGLLSSILNYTLLVSTSAFFAGAVFTHARRSIISRKNQSAYLACWCMATGVAATFYGVSINEYDSCWWTAMSISACAGIILLVGINRENSKAYIGVQEKIGELEVLHALSWKLVGTGTLVTLVEAFASALAENFKADIAAVFLKEPGEEGLRLVSSAGRIHLPAWSMEKVYSLKEDRRPGFHSGHTARAFSECKLVVVEDIFTDVEFLPWQVLAEHEGTVVSVPIISSGEVLGVYNLFLPTREKITDERKRLYETVAAAAGAAIQHVQIRTNAGYSMELNEAA